MDKDKDFEITFAPQFTEQLSKMSEEDRNKILAALGDMKKAISSNPYEADPINASLLYNIRHRIRRYHRRWQLWLRNRNAA